MTIEDALRQVASVAQIRFAASATGTYMTDPGFTAPPYPPREGAAGPLRIVSGRLSRSLQVGEDATGGREDIAEVQISDSGLRFLWGSRTPYAIVHEEGFSGSVNVPAHQRRITQAFGRDIEPRTITVSAHTKNMNIPARPYLGPSLDDNIDGIANLLSDLMVGVVMNIELPGQS